MGRRAKQEYVNNKDFLAAMIEYKASVQTAETKNKTRPIVPTYVGECIMKIATHLARKPNFVNYTFKEEMISDGIENCLQYIDNFNPEQTNLFDKTAETQEHDNSRNFKDEIKVSEWTQQYMNEFISDFETNKRRKIKKRKV